MLRGQPTRNVRPLRRPGAALLAAGLGLLLTGLLFSGIASGVSPVVDGTVSQVHIQIDSLCEPGTLAAGYSISETQPINISSNEVIEVDGDVAGCFATNVSPGLVLISGAELFSYSTVAVRTHTDDVAEGTPGPVTPFWLPVANMTGQPDLDYFPDAGEVYVGEERMEFDQFDDILGQIRIVERGLNGIAPEHPVKDLVRLQGHLRLVGRDQPSYTGGPTPAGNATDHSEGATVTGPKTYLICRGRLDESGANRVDSRSRCYGLFEPGYSGGPNDPWWPDGLPPDNYYGATGATLILPPLPPDTPNSDWHDEATGTLTDDDLYLEHKNPFTGFDTCGPFVLIDDHGLWVKVTTEMMNLDKTAFNTDYGKFHATLYRDSQCTELSSIPAMGSQDNPFGQGAGINLKSTEVSDTYDSDGDGCQDLSELRGDDPLGFNGSYRDPFYPYDIFDVNGDGKVDLPNDILGVILRWSPNPSQPYSTNYDRGPTLGNPEEDFPGGWVRQPPDGTIDLPNDILGVILQWTHEC